MTEDWLIAAAGKAFGKKTVVLLTGRIYGENYPPETLIDICFHPVKETAFRAAWLLEHTVEKYPGWFAPAVAHFLQRYPDQPYFSCRRHFTKIMMQLTHPSSGRLFTRQLQGSTMEKVIESTFEWLVEPGTPVAVQVNCLDVLYNLRDTTDWLAAELRLHIPFLLVNGSTALQTRGKKILAKLG